MQSLSESRGGSKVIKSFFSNSTKRYWSSDIYGSGGGDDINR